MDRRDCQHADPWHDAPSAHRPVRDERAALLAIPARRFELVTCHHGRVHLDTHVAFDKRLYSVPWPMIGQMVWVRATATDVVIFADDVRVTTHD